MADQSRTSRRSGNGTASEAVAERETGERVILKRERVIVLPEGIDAEHAEPLLKQVRETVGNRATKAQLTDAWVEVARVTARDKRTAIKQHAGEPNTPDAKPGVYRAPTASSWTGG